MKKTAIFILIAMGDILVGCALGVVLASCWWQDAPSQPLPKGVHAIVLITYDGDEKDAMQAAKDIIKRTKLPWTVSYPNDLVPILVKKDKAQDAKKALLNQGFLVIDPQEKK